MIISKLFHNINTITKSLFTFIFFTKFNFSNGAISAKDIIKRDVVEDKDILNYINFENNFDNKRYYAAFIMNIKERFDLKLLSSYTITSFRKNNKISNDDFSDYYRRMLTNFVSKLSSRKSILSNFIDNERFENSFISPFKANARALDLFDQRAKYLPIYLSDIYLKAKLQLNNTGFKNFIFEKFYNITAKEKVRFIFNQKKEIITSVSNWWFTTNDGYYTDYKILLIFIFSSFFISFAIFVISNLVGNSTSIFFERSKTSVYECGFQPFERIDKCQIFVFYRLSIFFIIFEAELIFLFPWAINVCEMSIYSISYFYNASFFIFILFYGFIYEIKNKALDI